ncbi:hypothetical protein EASAB2608_02864 [Streptomyces sp. EAS-AB2608]|nr:hypothetical protein EASAB2608_02864 [Streptomyces sp. EAS-AB2608]
MLRQGSAAILAFEDFRFERARGSGIHGTDFRCDRRRDRFSLPIRERVHSRLGNTRWSYRTWSRPETLGEHPNFIGDRPVAGTGRPASKRTEQNHDHPPLIPVAPARSALGTAPE